MALTAEQRYVTRGTSSGRFLDNPIIASSTTIFFGALVDIASGTGHLVNHADTAGHQFLGVAIPNANSIAGDPTASPPTRCPVDAGGLILENVSVTGVTGAGNISELVYASDENTFTLTASTNVDAVGVVLNHRSGTNVDIRLFTAAEHRGTPA